MKAALIPPIPDLRRVPNMGIHLVLSHLFEDPRYFSYYQQCRIAGDYLILDNGAHELGVGQMNETLLGHARTIQAQEVVLPDVLFDRRGTVERTKAMLKWVGKQGWVHYLEAGRPRFMMVPQGSDRAEWSQCLKALLSFWDFYTLEYPETIQPPVIGISKDYDNWRGGLHYLIKHYVEPLYNEREFDVHCLGWPSNLWSLAKVAREFPWIRSTDSARPFVYAKHGILLEPGGMVPKYPKRDPEYFTESLAGDRWETVKRNILVFQATAMDEIIVKV